MATALLASSFASTLGALADIDFGGGDDSAVAGVTGATPQKVSPGNVAGFYLWARNADSANLSSFFLNAAVTDATLYGAIWSHDPGGPWTPCATSPALKCAFGAFNAGTSIYILAAFTVPANSSKNCLPADSTSGIAADTSRSHVCVDFQFGASSGYVPGKNSSRGDAYHWYDVVYTDTGGDASAQFPFDASLLTVSDTKTLGKSNLQWTQVQAPAGAVGSAFGTTGIGVADHFVSSPCIGNSNSACLTNFLGEWSQVDVNSGEDFAAGTPWVQIDIGIYGVSANRISTVYHFYQINDTGPWLLEQLGLCPTADGPATTSSPACFWVSTLKGSSSQVTVWTHHNGKLNIG